MATSRRLAANLVSGISTNLVRVLVQLIMLPLMARLLGPAELGLYALAMPMINFVLLLSDAGIGDSLAKERSASGLVWSSAFWGLLVIGCLSAAGIYGASFIIAEATRQPRLPEIILPLSVTLVLVAVTIVPSALMVRGGNMVPGAVADMAGNLMGAVAGIACALMGWGVWALVAQYVTGYVVRAIGYNIAQPFLPRMEFSARSLLSHTGMGGQILGGRLMELAVSMFERSRVSLKLGPAAVGGYTNANQIGFFTSNAVGSPMWANLYYVALHKKPGEVVAAFVRSHRLFALLVFPAATVLALDAPTIVPLLLGPEWSASIGSIMVMVLTAPFGNLAVLHSAILYARGLGRYVLLGQAGALLFRVGVVVFWWRYGILGLSIGLGASSVAYYVATSLLFSPIIGNRARDLFAVAAAPLLASAAAGALLWRMQGSEPTVSTVILSSAAAVAVYAVLLLFFDRHHVRKDIKAMMATIGARPAAGST